MNIENSAGTQSGAPEGLPDEIRHIPLWVKSIVAAALVIFLIQLPNFKDSLTDAVQKKKASAAFNAGEYRKATDIYKQLHSRYMSDHDLTKQLGLSQYQAGEYAAALSTFNLLQGIKLPNRDVDEINYAIKDIEFKLKQQIR